MENLKIKPNLDKFKNIDYKKAFSSIRQLLLENKKFKKDNGWREF